MAMTRALCVAGALLAAACTPAVRIVDTVSNRVDRPVVACPNGISYYCHNEVSAHADLEPGRPLRLLDLHADSLLAERDLVAYGRSGHVDFPRMREGRLALQVFTAVTHMPLCRSVGCRAWPNLAGLKPFFSADWPRDAWVSQKSMALHQLNKMDGFRRRDAAFRLILSRADLDAFVAARLAEERRGGGRLIAGLLGMEGTEAFEGDIENFTTFHAAGVRLIGLVHFIDTDFAHSRHGRNPGGGLTARGRVLVRRMLDYGVVVDLAHASEATMRDTIDEMRTWSRERRRPAPPPVVSHGGVQGTCFDPRNLADREIELIAKAGGVIGIGVWQMAVCTDHIPRNDKGEPSLPVRAAMATAKAIAYTVSVRCPTLPKEPRARAACFAHVALGSDFDGFVGTGFDATGYGLVARVLLADHGFGPADVAAITWGNALRALRGGLM